MVEVDELFCGGQYKTEVLISRSAIELLEEYRRKYERHKGAFLAKLEYWAEAGFRLFEGDEKPVRHEGNGVYRIAHGDLFRLVGFYEDDTPKTFVIITAFTKRGKKLGSTERARIAEVAEIKQKCLWHRRAKNGNGKGPSEITQ